MSLRPARSIRLSLVMAAVLGGLLPASVNAATVTVHIRESLSPRSITVAPGTTVRWVNESDNRYRIRSRTGPVEFDSHNLEPGESFGFTFTVAGTYPYVDDRDRDDADFHGTVIVTTEASPTAPKPPAGGAGGSAPTSATIHMAGRAFSPESVTIAAGGSIRFVNDDDREHTATGDAFDTGVLNPGAQSNKSFASPGTFTFLCQIHPEMRGTVNVGGGSGTASPSQPAATPTPSPLPTPVPPIVPEPGRQTASIVDFAFEPGEIDVAVGTTVTWQNRGEAPHTVTAHDGSFESGPIAAGASYTRTFESAGRFAFACQFHPEMVGTVVVNSTNSGGGSAASPLPTPSTASSTTPAAPPAGGVAQAGPPDAAVAPDSRPATAEIADGTLRLLLVGAIVAVAVIAFGVLIAGTARNGRNGPTH